MQLLLPMTDELAGGLLIEAPWSPAAVISLNRLQVASHQTPYRCPDAYQGGHRDARLVATVEGWRCPHCTYVQTTAIQPGGNLGADPMRYEDVAWLLGAYRRFGCPVKHEVRVLEAILVRLRQSQLAL